MEKCYFCPEFIFMRPADVVRGDVIRSIPRREAAQLLFELGVINTVGEETRSHYQLHQLLYSAIANLSFPNPEEKLRIPFTHARGRPCERCHRSACPLHESKCQKCKGVFCFGCLCKVLASETGEMRLVCGTCLL